MPKLPFNTNTTNWSADNALALSIACQLAYDKNQVAVEPKVHATLGTKRYLAFDSKNNQANSLKEDTQGFLAGDRSKIILAFRGTTSIRDWMSDFDILPVDFNHLFPNMPDVGHIHAGFGLALKSAWPQIATGLASFRQDFPSASLWVTGHSLGAALAVVATGALLFDNQNRTPVSGLYTYGQPRVGQTDFVVSMNGVFKSRHYRVVNNQDIVTRVPPRINGYRQQGRLVYFDDKGRISNKEGWWDAFVREVEVNFQVFREAKGPIADHNLQTGYIDHLQSYVDGGAKPPLKW